MRFRVKAEREKLYSTAIPTSYSKTDSSKRREWGGKESEEEERKILKEGARST